MSKQVIIVGGGIVGSTLAYYLTRNSDFSVTLIDKGDGQATRAAAGIICPWLSQRRNQDWYRLASQGAAFYPKLMADLQADGIQDLPYQQTGTLVFKKQPQILEKLEKIAQDRRVQAPQIGKIHSYQQGLDRLIPPLKTEQGAIFASGGGRVDGGQLVTDLQALFQDRGGRLIQGQATLIDSRTLSVCHQLLEADQLILTAGAWLPQLLTPLGYHVDIRPQKGQLLEIETDFKTEQWPGCMLQGEIDILPFGHGKLVIGASHEDDMGYDLSPNPKIISQMKEEASQFIADLAHSPISKIRVGTRAYTSDFLPFYGPLEDMEHLWVVSGLGSSGLTSGPFIAWQIAETLCGHETFFDPSPYSPAPYVYCPWLSQSIP